MMKIGLLIADFPLQHLAEKYGDYELMFSQLLVQAASSQSINLEIVAFNALEEQYPDMNQIITFDAFLITGSKFSAYQDLPWILRLKKFVAETTASYAAIKFIGICFGHQIIAEALGGKVAPNPRGWEVGWTEISLNEQGRELLNTDKTTFCIQEMHQDEVSIVPQGLVTIASTSSCACQAMIKPGHILTIQSHPEFKPKYVSALIKLRHEKGIFTTEQKDKWLAVVNKDTDGTWFAEKIIAFIEGKC